VSTARSALRPRPPEGVGRRQRAHLRREHRTTVSTSSSNEERARVDHPLRPTPRRIVHHHTRRNHLHRQTPTHPHPDTTAPRRPTVLTGRRRINGPGRTRPDPPGRHT